MARWVKLVRVCCDGASCIPLLAALASPFALRRGAIGVVCFHWVPASAGMTWGVCGNDEGGCGNDEVLVGMTVQIRGVVGGTRALRPSPCIPLLAALASPFALRRGGVLVR